MTSYFAQFPLLAALRWFALAALASAAQATQEPAPNGSDPAAGAEQEPSAARTPAESAAAGQTAPTAGQSGEEGAPELPEASPETPPEPPPPIEITNAGLVEELIALVGRFPERARMNTYGNSSSGQALWRLDVRGVDAAEDGPRLLIVAALDGWRCYETRLALHLAEAVLAAGTTPSTGSSGPGEEESLDVLRTCRLVVVPRADPDGAERRLSGGTASPLAWSLDSDRDGQSVETGPIDINGDGLASWMRFEHEDGRLRPDAEEARLLGQPKFELGETGRWRLERESRDVDGDGRFAEDGPLQVLLAQQFPAGWPEHTPAAGPWPGYLPEARALMELVLALEEQQLWGALVLDSYDTLIEPAEAAGSERLPNPGFLAGDLPWAKEISKRFRESSGIEKRPRGDSAGRFERWLYEQRGLYTLSWRTFDLPESDPKSDGEPAKAEASNDAAQAAQAADGAATAPEPAPPAASPNPGAATQPTVSVPLNAANNRSRRGRSGAGASSGNSGGSGGSNDQDLERERRQLAWIDSQAAEAWRFLPWTAFEHPELGPVELGGWHPLARLDPPAADQNRWLGAGVELLRELCQSAPRVEFGALEAKPLGNNLYELEIELLDSGLAPMISAAAQRARTQRPGWLRIELPDKAQLVVGEALQRFERLEGPDQSTRQRLLISASPGSSVRLGFTTHNAGNGSSEITLP